MTEAFSPATLGLPEDFYATVLGNVRSLVFVKDRNSNIVYANQAFIDLHPPEKRGAVIGSNPHHMFDEAEAQVFNEQDRIALESGFTEIVEELTDYTGRTRTLQTQKMRLMGRDRQNYILGIANDVTQLSARERALAQSNIALERFAAGAAHDLRSPLASVASALSFIEDDANSQMSPAAQRQAQLAAHCLEGLMEQIQGLLDAAKALTAPQVAAPCDMALLFEEVRFSLSQSIAEHRALVLHGSLPVIRADKALLRQILCNLAENSLKYRSEARPILMLRHLTEGRDHLFVFEDNGRGVAAEVQGRLFEHGVQGDARSSGAGLGLALCRQIVEAQGGQIWHDRSYTPGCRICFTLPIGD